MALTTTIGLCERRSHTMAAARSMAEASSTEVPPNFITIMAPPDRSSSQISLNGEELSIQQRCSRSATDGVVREYSKLPVEQGARSQAPDAGGHPTATVHIQPRLRSVGSRIIKKRFLGRAGKPEFLRHAAKAGPGLDHLISARRPEQLYRNRFGMTVFHRHAIAVRSNAELAWFHFAAIQLAQQLSGFCLQLFFFFCDVGNYIAQDVE